MFKIWPISELKFILIIIFAINLPFVSGSSKVKLKEVEVLTLSKGKSTTGRRNSPIPQLQCIGGSAGCADKITPAVVQCYNRGSDGFDVQWECKADMDAAYKFGTVQVSCEGYDYPDDPYVLKGSCGLEYTLDNTGYGGESDGYYHYEPKSRKKSSFMSDLVLWIIIGLFIYLLYRIFTTPRPGASSGSSGHGGGGGGGGGGPPPPGFRPDYYPGDSCDGGSGSTYYSSGYSSGAGAGGMRPGFWTGLGAGSLLGYLFGNRGNDYYYANRPTWGARPFGGGGGSAFPSTGLGTSGMRTSSGFGGTRRR